MKCLIADHSMVTRRAILCALRPLDGPDLVETATVEDALAACDGTVDVVVAGWSENGLDGLDLVRRLRERGEGTVPRIVLVTPHNRRDRVLEAVAAGIDGYVLRPFDPDLLRERVAALVSAADAAGEDGKQAA